MYLLLSDDITYTKLSGHEGWPSDMRCCYHFVLLVYLVYTHSYAVNGVI